MMKEDPKGPTPTPDERRSKMRRVNYDYMRELKDPCVKENEYTMKCLDEAGYDRTKCEKYFLNYRICRKFWSRVEKDRKKNGIKPHLPPPNEREEVKKEYSHFISGN